jgi:hypothetical protein
MLKVADVAINYVKLSVDLKGLDAKVPVRKGWELKGLLGARICRALRPAGPYEEVGVAHEETYVDAADLEPGRTYYYRVAAWTGQWSFREADCWREGKPVSAKIPRAPKEKSAILTRRRQEFTARVGGYLDESNTVTKGPEVYCPGPNRSMPPYDQAFEPNLYVVVENVGETDVVNPWVVANGRRDWWSVETMVREIVGGRELTETEKAMAVYQFGVDEVYDSRVGLSWYDDINDPVKLYNVYGFEGCSTQAMASRRLAETMGLRAREVWVGDLATLDGHGRGRVCNHAVFEAYADGLWHFLDTDLMVFFLKRDNRTVAGAEDLARDVDLIRRSHRNLGLCGRDMAEKEFCDPHFINRRLVYPSNKGGVWMDKAGGFIHAPGRYPPPHTMSLRLRPGEKLVRYWDNVGKNVVRGRQLHPNVRFSNGKLVYRPDLRRSASLKRVERLTNMAQAKSGRRAALHPARVKEISEAVWKVESPYAIAGARVGLTCRRESQEDGLEVMFSKDGRSWRSVWVMMGYRMDECVDLDWYLNPALNDWRGEKDLGWCAGPCYEYYIKVAMWAGSRPDGVGLDAIRFDTDIQCATRSLPSLFCGKNIISYRDDNRGPRRVRVTSGWQEEHSTWPPGAPGLIFPEPGAGVDRLDFEFRWRKPRRRGPKVDDYHIQVSRYPDFRWPVCPTFDRYVGRTAYAGQTRWQTQFPNLLNPDETYYWRVRARNVRGVWGEWSEVHAFTPHGPRHPVGLAIQKRGRDWRLTWSPNPAGNPPVKYRVYGSSELEAFSVREDCLLGTVEGLGWPVQKSPRGRRVSYRVVAVDANDVPSTPSDYVVF